ncbi:MAG: SDR family NAD(P)-dependent oxidoreductase [Halioglobus sp.]|nr:SDR family NAD(P)-dependent oxidoreductase [Halioglobus sp.]
MSLRVLVYGATSGICHEVLKRYATEGAGFFLVGRNAQKLAAVADDLVARGGEVLGSSSYDFKDWGQHEPVIAQAVERLGAIDVALVAHGTLPEQLETEVSTAATQACMDDNFTSVTVVTQALAQQLALQGQGKLAVISSVAGDRGRKSNYTYGATKAGIDAFLAGLQGRFSGTDIRVVNIKPGMTVSPMTAHMAHGLLWSTAQDIAPGIHNAINRGTPVHYAPGYWRLIMLIIRLLPTAVVAKLPI